MTMTRKISFADVQKAVDEAYEQFKSLKDGAVNPKIAGVDDKAFGISVVLTDGRSYGKADQTILFPLGGISKLPVAVTLLSQNSPEELARKSGNCACACGAKKEEKPKLPHSRRGLRAISAVVPTGDPEGKYNMILNQLLAMGTQSPVLNEKLYKEMTDTDKSENVLQTIADAHFELLDDAAQSLDIQNKLESLQMSTEGLAQVGATLAADGLNAATGTYAFDGAIAQNVVALMAAGGKCRRPWMMLTGLPVRKSFAGGLLAVLPGFGAIAVYSPLTDEKGWSVKGKKALEYISQKLQLSVYASARVEVEK